MNKDTVFEKRSEQNEELREREISEQIEEENKKREQDRLENFKIKNDDLGVGGAKTKFLFNVTAISLFKELESEDRYASPKEQETLSKYVGFGSISQAFDKDNILEPSMATGNFLDYSLTK